METNNCWIYKGECLTTPPEGYWGYIYLITNLVDGKIYIGKKQFTHRKKTKLSKKARVGTRKRVKVEQVDSQWLNYWSSSKELKEDVAKLGEDKFKREILMLCKNKAELTYYEGFYMYGYSVLFVPSYNKWLFVRVYKNNLLVNNNIIDMYPNYKLNFRNRKGFIEFIINSIIPEDTESFGYTVKLVE